MLTYLHRGTSRYREDAYRSYCEYVDLSGLCQPEFGPMLDSTLIRTLERLSQAGPPARLNKIRSAVEHLCRKVTGKARLGLYEQIQLIQNNRLMSQKAVGYLHTLRILGNLASHPSGEQLSNGDVRVASFALACVIDEFACKGSVHPRSS